MRQTDDTLRLVDGRVTDAPAERNPRLLDELRQALRHRHHNCSTEKRHYHWAKRFILFHVVHCPAEVREPEINANSAQLAAMGEASAARDPKRSV